VSARGPRQFAEPAAAALEILDRAHIRPTERVAVVGDGKLGLLCAQALRLPGCAVVVVGRHPERWELLDRQGIVTVQADDTPGTGDWRLETRERRATESTRNRTQSSQFSILNSQFDVVVDCTGHPSGLATARRLVRPRGRLILKSTFAGDSPLDLSMLVVDEVQVLGSRCGPFAPALRLLAGGLIAVEPLIDGRFSLRDGLNAFGAARGRLKILLEV
jgi:alcohol dehydrogenase